MIPVPTRKAYRDLAPENRSRDVKGGEKVGHRGGQTVYHRHDEKELNWEPGGVR